MTDYTVQVQRGIATLEQYRPGSTALIDLPTLDISADSYCAASQAVSIPLHDEPDMASYAEALALMEIEEDEAVEMGFELPRELRESHPPSDLAAEYGDLTAAWRTALSARR